MLLELNSKRLYHSSRKEKESYCLVIPSSTKREIRQFHVVVVHRRLRSKCTKKRDARAKIMVFVCHPKILHKHCLQFLLGVKMAPRESENNVYAKFWGDKQRPLWYVMVFYFALLVAVAVSWLCHGWLVQFVNIYI